MKKESFVATATAVGVVVEVVRLPVYLATQGHDLLRVWPLVALTTVGARVGTVVGERVLRRIAEEVFRIVVSLVLLALGATLFTSGGPS